MAVFFKNYHKDKIYMGGVLYEVSPEVAKAVNNADWNEAYQERKKNKPVKSRSRNAGSGDDDFDPRASSRECSLDALIESGAEHYLHAETESLEDSVLDKLTTARRIEILRCILPDLSKEEKRMLLTITDNISSRQYEKLYGIPRRTMDERRSKLLGGLKRRILAEERSGLSFGIERMEPIDIRVLLMQ